jgi:hypothetical protein
VLERVCRYGSSMAEEKMPGHPWCWLSCASVLLGGCGAPPPALVLPGGASATAQASLAPQASAAVVQAPSPPPGVEAVAPRAFVMPPPSHGRSAATRALATANDLRLKRRWRARVGLTTFRSTLSATAGAIVIGTHGKSLSGVNEASDGVYVLDAKTGKLLRFVATPGSGDRDVGGVALDQEAIVFTTDNAQVVRARLDDGALQWQAGLFGKARPAPALGQLNGVGALDVVVGDEIGMLYAIDGDSGKPLWVKPTGKNDYDASGFVAAAAIADLDADGQVDVVAGARDGALVAYAGRDGHELWRQADGSGIHASPSIGDFDGDGRLDVLAAWSYSRIAIFAAASGELRYEQRLEQDSGGIEGLFASPVPLPRRTGPAWLVQGTSWWGGSRGKRTTDTVDGVVLAGQMGREFRSDEGRVSATAVILDLDDDGSFEAVLGTEAGELLALGADGTRRSLGRLGGSIEATALVTDVDGDGTFELLVASNDGFVTCLQTESRTPPLLARFRGNANDNRGTLDGFDLRWLLAGALRKL